jgi:hypothetical protein
MSPFGEKWMSCGRQSPFALEPSGLRMTMQVKLAPAGQRLSPVVAVVWACPSSTSR